MVCPRPLLSLTQHFLASLCSIVPVSVVTSAGPRRQRGCRIRRMMSCLKPSLQEAKLLPGSQQESQNRHCLQSVLARACTCTKVCGNQLIEFFEVGL